MDPLPIDPLLPDIVALLEKTRRLVLEAPPGAGKTTRVPRALLDAGVADSGEIIVLEPRRLAARMAASRVAEELGENVGERVGYTIRFEEAASARTRIRFVTEGVLTRRLLDDPTLAGIAAVLLDEFHERHIHADVALALLHRLQRTTRPDLRLVVMSATLATEPVSQFLDAPTLRAEGKRFDVAIEHLPKPDERPIEAQVASSVRRILSSELGGDVLVFLPGAAEIRKTLEACTPLATEYSLLLLPLHGDLSAADQDRAIRKADRPKVIVATNVAESSITIDGVTHVIDIGLARVVTHSPWSGLSRLQTAKISRASATQRAGRAGRTRPGRCVRLYTQADYENRPEHDLPEIVRLDLAQTVLELCASQVSGLHWLDPPPPTTLDAAYGLLTRLGAITAERTLTEIGRKMLRYPLHPRQARLLVEAERSGVISDACVIAALLGERDIRVGAKARFDSREAHAAVATEPSDVVAQLDRFREAEAARFSAHALRNIGLDPGAVFAVDRARNQLERMTRGANAAALPVEKRDPAIMHAVLVGYPDRVARRLQPGGRRLALVGGTTAELSEASAVRNAEWVVAVDAEEQRGRVVVRMASAIEPEWLLEAFPHAIAESVDVRWNASAERAEALGRVLYEGLVLDESPLRNPPRDELSRVLAKAAVEAGPAAFAPDAALDLWIARARFASSLDPAIEAPTDETVRATLIAMCTDATSFAELRERSLLQELKIRTDPAQLARIETLAPEWITLLRGRRIKIEYADGKPPAIASRLQDFFGMNDGPRLGKNGPPLVLHLLGPNQRAVQVTSDLAGFWSRHYPSIRKELSRRYPRHAWPEDPMS